MPWASKLLRSVCQWRKNPIFFFLFLCFFVSLIYFKKIMLLKTCLGHLSYWEVSVKQNGLLLITFFLLRNMFLDKPDCEYKKCLEMAREKSIHFEIIWNRSMANLVNIDWDYTILLILNLLICFCSKCEELRSDMKMTGCYLTG